MAEVMRIAESYFQRLLHETPALTAVHEIAEMWHPRINAAAARLGLSPTEHNVQMVLIYTGEVGNGGHEQLFMNRPPDILQRIKSALPIAGFDDLAKCFDLASVAQVAGQVDRLPDLDREVWRIKSVDDRLLAYLRRNEAEVLQQERGLSRTAW